MNKRTKSLFLVIIFGFCLIMLANTLRIWYPALPFESKSKREVTELLDEYTGSIVKLTTENNIDWYGAQSD
ncbi:hypothetical protein [Brevibacillus fortis]|uniref:hypothetical protein n=1 Tax=Brevibacillus fortis TaxID=2126352 RepID=UPI001FC8F955|nr:hypothetical protein [Brevibacillus fortis]